MRTTDIGREDESTVEKSVRDREIVEAFISELEDGGDSETVLDRSDADKVVGRAIYRLVDPYCGDNFPSYLVNNDKVTAEVELTVQAGTDRATYRGMITDNAYDIFDPESVLG